MAVRRDSVGHLDLPPVGSMIADKSGERVDRAMIFAWLPVFFGGVMVRNMVPALRLLAMRPPHVDVRRLL